jgi:hypothetical protein
MTLSFAAWKHASAAEGLAAASAVETGWRRSAVKPLCDDAFKLLLSDARWQ